MTKIYYICGKKLADVGVEPFNGPRGTSAVQFSRHRIDSDVANAFQIEQAGNNQDFALIRSKGDQALFGKSTQAMKAQWKVPDSRPLAEGNQSLTATALRACGGTM